MIVSNKKQRNLIISVCLSMLFLSSSNLCYAKLLPRYRKTSQTASNTVSAGIITAVSMRGDRQAINVFFSNLSKAKTVSYTLVYQSQGVDKGVSGSIDLSSGNSATRELVFGTASSGVYRYDTSITNTKLEIVTELLTGKKTLRRFRIRV
jgi:hypothetical protein